MSDKGDSAGIISFDFTFIKMSPFWNFFLTLVADLFGDIVPVSVHQAMAAYDLRKTEIQNAEISKLRESTQLLNR